MLGTAKQLAKRAGKRVVRRWLSGRVQRLSAAGGAAGVWRKVNALAARPGMLNMGQGFPDFPGSEVARAAARRALDDAPVNQYSPQAGQEGLRGAIAAFYHRHYGAELDPASEVVVTASGQEALSATFLALLDPGDEVVIFEPFYPFLLGAIELAGGVPRVVRLSPPEFAISVDAVAAVVNEKTRMIVHNRCVSGLCAASAVPFSAFHVMPEPLVFGLVWS